jgi:hypothetical protein
MPDLSEESDKKILFHLLNVFFTGGGPSDYQAAAFSRNFIRLCDQATKEYELARQALMEQVSTPNNVMSPLFQAAGHFEQCISAIRRAIRFSRHKKGPRLPRTEVLSDRVEKKLRDMRDAIEHTDSRIRKGQIVDGDPIMLMVKSDSIELGGVEIYYDELARWIKQLNGLAEVVARYREEGKEQTTRQTG